MSRQKAVGFDSIAENLFEDSYPPLPLPMIWRVIYQEAIRGNHILWEANELAEIEAKIREADIKIDLAESGAVIAFMAKLLSSSDYRELRQMIASVPRQRRPIVFILYRRAISVWQRWLKSNLH